MTQSVLTCSEPPHWRVAVIGSGPAGFYSIGELFRQQDQLVKAVAGEVGFVPFAIFVILAFRVVEDILGADDAAPVVVGQLMVYAVERQLQS